GFPDATHISCGSSRPSTPALATKQIKKEQIEQCARTSRTEKVMKRQNQFLTLLLILGAWPGLSATQAATADAVVAWGDNGFGQTTVPLAARSGVTAIAAGSSYTVALKNDGSVVAWGYNGNGQTDVPAGLSGVTAIAAGGDHTVALRSDGSVVAW